MSKVATRVDACLMPMQYRLCLGKAKYHCIAVNKKNEKIECQALSQDFVVGGGAILLR